MQPSHDDIFQKVSALTDLEFAELMAKLTAARPGRWFVGVAEHTDLAASAWRWHKEILALPDPAEYGPEGWDREAPFCRTAYCGSCDTQLISCAKHMICPICESMEYGH